MLQPLALANPDLLAPDDLSDLVAVYVSYATALQVCLENFLINVGCRRFITPPAGRSHRTSYSPILS